MPAFPQTGDITKQYLSYPRIIQGFRGSPGVSYPIGSCVKLLSQDQQQYPDALTVGTPNTLGTNLFVMGLIPEIWPGFDGNGLTTCPGANVRGTSDVDIVTSGYHPAGLVDNSGTGAVTITNEVALVPSRGTAGYMQGVTTPVAAFGTVGVALLPASGLFSSLTAAALVQAYCTDTIAGTPTLGDTYTINLQIPYNSAYPGVAQTSSFVVTLGAGQTTNVTVAAAAVVTALNATAAYSKYWTASSAAGVITHTFNQNVPWTVNFAGNYAGISIVSATIAGYSNGSAMNGATHTSSVVGVSTFTSSGNFANGTGYKGPIPVMVV